MGERTGRKGGDFVDKKMKEKKKYHTDGTVPKSNRKIVERVKIDTANTQKHDRSLSWSGTSISID